MFHRISLSIKKLKKNHNSNVLNAEPVNFFVITSLIFGLIFIFIIPPFQSPDEAVHFLRSYQVSELDPALDDIGNGKLGDNFPGSIKETFITTTTNPTISFRPDLQYEINKTFDALKIESESQEIGYDFSATATYGPVAYLPQAIGVGLARILDLPVIAMMYAGRFVNLIAWVLLVAAAIKLIPIKKWVMVFIGLLPMALAQSSSLSSDVMSYGLFLLYAAFVFKIVYEKKLIDRNSIIKLLIIGSALSLTKQLMFIFIPLALIISKDQFKTFRQHIITKTLLIMIPIFVLFVWLIFSNSGSPDALVNNGQNPKEQIKYILFNPDNFLGALFSTYFLTWGDGVFSSLIGNFGWVDTPLSMPFVILGYISLTALMLLRVRDDKALFKSSRTQKFIIFSVMFAYFMATNLALYLFYTPLHFEIIYGLQGRYFIPLLPLLIFVISKNYSTISSVGYKKIATYSSLILLLSSTLTIFLRYYVDGA